MRLWSVSFQDPRQGVCMNTWSKMEEKRGYGAPARGQGHQTWQRTQASTPKPYNYTKFGILNAPKYTPTHPYQALQFEFLPYIIKPPHNDASNSYSVRGISACSFFRAPARALLFRSETKLFIFRVRFIAIITATMTPTLTIHELAPELIYQIMENFKPQGPIDYVRDQPLQVCVVTLQMSVGTPNECAETLKGSAQTSKTCIKTKK
ncbi:hypothetical protein BJ165DRAFT_1408448 [Panaeolus papilionaceus]|nr:hypothetical protein BJ165DRAFT_1408448 [Panaeolus papilionaceus]